jgi:hypothetical protein
VHAEQVQLDDLFAPLSAVQDGETSATTASKRRARSPHWLWVAMDPVTKVVLPVDVGARTLTMAPWVVHHLVQVLAPDCLPLFLTDGFREDLVALVTHYGHWEQCEHPQAKGPIPKPRWLPRPGLLYAQVLKTVCRRR